ncbi:hypothetical protein LJR289_001898 [Pseudoduganella sp. LjRoot289]|uniref:citrate/2-methylcitrate synthase n=1 Tax=Pseudoduganella sp. LjRoot289 TaxID=3342314 RepID=UPI003ECC4098
MSAPMNAAAEAPLRGPALLQHHAGRLHTKVGAAFPGSHAVFRGHDLHRELRELEWVQLYAYGITGRHLTPAQAELVQALWTHTAYPDARLWNNRVAALAGSARSSATLGMVAGMAVSEATVYGGQAALLSMSFLQNALRRVQAGEVLADVVWAETARSKIYGYGRPINSTDERLPWIMQLAERLGLHDGPHLALAWQVEQVLLTRYTQLRMNYTALHAAIIADMGLSVREYQLLRVPVFIAGMAPCLAEAAEKPEGVLFATPCSAVDYKGAPPRPWHGSKSPAPPA